MDLPFLLFLKMQAVKKEIAAEVRFAFGIPATSAAFAFVIINPVRDLSTEIYERTVVV